MLVIKVEIWPFGREHRRREIGRMYVSNVTPDDEELVVGDYSVAVGRMTEACSCHQEAFQCASTGSVKGHKRKSPVWALVAKALGSVGFSA